MVELQFRLPLSLTLSPEYRGEGRKRGQVGTSAERLRFWVARSEYSKGVGSAS